MGTRRKPNVAIQFNWIEFMNSKCFVISADRQLFNFRIFVSFAVRYVCFNSIIFHAPKCVLNTFCTFPRDTHWTIAWYDRIWSVLFQLILPLWSQATDSISWKSLSINAIFKLRFIMRQFSPLFVINSEWKLQVIFPKWML